MILPPLVFPVSYYEAHFSLNLSALLRELMTMRTNYLETFWHAMHLDNLVPGLGFPSNIQYLVSIRDCHVSNWNEALKNSIAKTLTLSKYN